MDTFELNIFFFFYLENDLLSFFIYQVNYKLRKLAEKMGPDRERFETLANLVEEFTNGLLDPLRSEKNWRQIFGDSILDGVVNVAIENGQGKVPFYGKFSPSNKT